MDKLKKAQSNSSGLQLAFPPSLEKKISSTGSTMPGASMSSVKTSPRPNPKRETSSTKLKAMFLKKKASPKQIHYKFPLKTRIFEKIFRASFEGLGISDNIQEEIIFLIQENITPEQVQIESLLGMIRTIITEYQKYSAVVRVQKIARRWLAIRRFSQMKEQINQSDGYYRKEFLLKIIQDETVYTEKLSIVQNKFLRTLQFKDKPLIPISDIKLIFANADSILLCHKEFLKKLEILKTSEWPNIPHLGQKIYSFATSLKLYGDYASNYHAAISILENSISKSQKFASFVSETEKENACSLSQLLSLPIERPTYYRQTVDELSKHCNRNTNYPRDTALVSKCSAIFSHIEGYISSCLDESKRIASLVTLQRKIVNLNKYQDLISGPKLREFIREGSCIISSYNLSNASGGSGSSSNLLSPNILNSNNNNLPIVTSSGVVGTNTKEKEKDLSKKQNKKKCSNLSVNLYLLTDLLMISVCKSKDKDKLKYYFQLSNLLISETSASFPSPILSHNKPSPRGLTSSDGGKTGSGRISMGNEPSWKLENAESGNGFFLSFKSDEESEQWKNDLKFYIAQRSFKVFGASLDVILEKEKSTSGIPRVLEEMLSQIKAKGLDSEGIFRVNSGKRNLESLRERYEKAISEQTTMNWEKEDIHTICGLVKDYFRKLPEPLLTYEFYDKVCPYLLQNDSSKESTKDSSVDGNNDKTDSESEIIPHNELKKFLSEIKHKNLIVFRYFVVFLNQVEKLKEKNKMGFMGLAIIFGPCFLFPSEDRIDPAMFSRRNDLMTWILEHSQTLLDLGEEKLE